MVNIATDATGLSKACLTTGTWTSLVIVAARHPLLGRYGTTPGNPYIQRHLYIDCGGSTAGSMTLSETKTRDPSDAGYSILPLYLPLVWCGGVFLLPIQVSAPPRLDTIDHGPGSLEVHLRPARLVP